MAPIHIADNTLGCCEKNTRPQGAAVESHTLSGKQYAPPSAVDTQTCPSLQPSAGVHTAPPQTCRVSPVQSTARHTEDSQRAAPSPVEVQGSPASFCPPQPVTSPAARSNAPRSIMVLRMVGSPSLVVMIEASIVSGPCFLQSQVHVSCSLSCGRGSLDVVWWQNPSVTAPV